MKTINVKEFQDISKNASYIIGLDEVGWGALAGPCVVCGIRAPKNWSLAGLNDSKKMTSLQRETVKEKIVNEINSGVITCFIAEKSNIEMDKLGPGPTLNSLYVESINSLYKNNDLIVLDGTLSLKDQKINNYNIVNIIKADQHVATVKAASIVAKVYRDSFMKSIAYKYPNFDFDSNFGYYSDSHIFAIEKYGLTDLHRRSYKIKKLSHLYT